MKKGLILIYPGFQNEAKKYQYGRIREELAKLKVETDIIKIDELFITIEDGKPNIDVAKYDFCIPLVQDKYINAFLEAHKIKSFNSFFSKASSGDKMLTLSLLAGHGIRLPNTIAGFGGNTGEEKIENMEVPEAFKKHAEKTLGYPLVAKKCRGKGGRDVYKIDNRKMLDDICEQFKGQPYILQEFIAENAGKDIRVVVLGGKAVGAYMRVNENDFRSNITIKGKRIPFELTAKYKNAAEKVARFLKLDFCSVDFFVSDDKEPILCEVNADPALVGAEEMSGKNIAGMFAKLIVNKVYKA